MQNYKFKINYFKFNNFKKFKTLISLLGHQISQLQISVFGMAILKAMCFEWGVLGYNLYRSTLKIPTTDYPQD